MAQVLRDALPPEVHQSGEARQLFVHLLPGVAMCRQLMALHQSFNGLHFRLSLALDLLGRLRCRVRDAEWMPRQRESLQVLPIPAVYLFPRSHLGSTRLDFSLGLLAGLSRLRARSVARQGLLGCLELLLGVFQTPADGE
jgi:hypothetical protein